MSEAKHRQRRTPNACQRESQPQGILTEMCYLMDWNRENAAKANLPDFLRAKMAMVSGRGQKAAKSAFEAGVKIAFGTDAAVYPHGLNAHEFAGYVRLGA